jgi:hypothetical protein
VVTVAQVCRQASQAHLLVVLEVAVVAQRQATLLELRATAVALAPIALLVLLAPPIQVAAVEVEEEGRIQIQGMMAVMAVRV